MYTSLCHSTHLSATLVTVPTKQTSVRRGSGAPPSVVASGACRGLSRFRSSSNLSNAGKVTAADMVHLQQQVRQEMADEIQQVRNEPNETANGRLDMLNGIATALQRVTANAAPRRYRISDLIARHRGGSNDKGEFRHFTTCTCGCKQGLKKQRQCWVSI